MPNESVEFKEEQGIVLTKIATTITWAMEHLGRRDAEKLERDVEILKREVQSAKLLGYL